MSLHKRLRRLEARWLQPGRCKLCAGWPPPVLRILDEDDPARKEDPPGAACPACGWRFPGTHTIVFGSTVVDQLTPPSEEAVEEVT